MNKIHNIQEIKFKGDLLTLKVDGKLFEIDIRTQSKKLANSTDSQKNNYKISPAGYGIHWPELDEDLSIDGLIGIKHQDNKKETA